MSVITLSANIEDMEEYTPLPQGTYGAQIRDVEEKVSEKIPEGYFSISLLVPVENFPADYDAANAPEGVILTYARLRKPTAENRRSVAPFKKFLRAIGAKEKGAAFDVNDWIGAEVNVLVSVNEYQGQLVNNVEAILPATRI